MKASELEFTELLERQRITSVYQPIISLSDASIFGYEALTRGPKGSKFFSPLPLFKYAEKHGYLYGLDKLAREKAIEGCQNLHRDQKVFINIPANVINDPHFTPGNTLKVLMKYGLRPHNVVFEITERTSIEDFTTTKKILQHYRNQGYQIAIDDAGAGYSSLQAIAELHPDFIKVDRSLVQKIDTDHVKGNILEIFVTLAEKMNISLIAEGIEHLDELFKLARLGVHYAQGYLLGKPEPDLYPLREEMKLHITKQNRMQITPKALWTIGDLISSTSSSEQDTAVSEVANFFKQNMNEMGVAIVSSGIPVGLVMRDKLFEQLAGQYGIPLYWNRPIAELMDADPLIVDEYMPVETVSQMATNRDNNKLYDVVIITSKGKLAGMATIRSILEYITNIRMEYAKVANPLTGLPGNIEIMRNINSRLMENKKFSVIYADLDFFKWYNDKYGFQKGDQLIQYMADVLQYSITVCGSPYDFVGHVGGDDFIVITAADDPEMLCKEMIRRFDSGISHFYEEECRFVEDRYGNLIEAGGVTVSLSLVICENHAKISVEQILRSAAALKKKAKLHRGSVYCREVIGEVTSTFPMSLSSNFE